MTQTEHLQLIRARCVELLTIWDGKRDHNSLYVASCAGAAEAGWRATLSAIEWLLPEVKHGPLTSAAVARQTLESIISAWPIELLNNK